MNDIWGNSINGRQDTNNSVFPRFNNYGYGNMLPRYELIKVNGLASAQNFRMAPNSDALLLDEKNPILYHVQTDGAGYLSVMAYDLIPHQIEPSVDINLLSQRVAQLEDIINARQSNTKQQKKQRNVSTDTEQSITNTGS